MSHIESSYHRENSTSRHQQNYTKSKRSSASVHDERSIKSLDFESDSCQTMNYDDYASEPVPTPKIRPTPPKKPLRLSLQRATSLQVVSIPETNIAPFADSTNGDKKRAIKRIHHRAELLKNHSRSIELSPKYIEKYV
jgi:sulfur dioxygenase